MDPENATNESPESEFHGATLAEELQVTSVEETPAYKGELIGLLESWRDHNDQPVRVETGEHGYPIIDLVDTNTEDAMGFLSSLDQQIHPVYHGMHNNELRSNAGMPDVVPWDSLDPALSHQPSERQAVYATKSLRGGLVHAVLEVKYEDVDASSGEVYALRPEPGVDGTESFIEVSPNLDAALRRGDERFTDGLLYVLPADQFTQSSGSNHEVLSKEKVHPIAVIRVGKRLGAEVVTPEARFVREE